MDSPDTSKNRTCPVCDEAVSLDTKICPSCSTDLTLFSAEDSVGDVDADELKKSLLSGNNGYISELMTAAEEEKPLSSPPAPAPQPVGVVYDNMVDCPGCGKPIPEDATKCQHCGAEFEVEEVFECPMCKSLLEITVTKCPSCGAEFEEDPEPAVAEAAPQPAPVPAPEPEKKPEPSSFAERLKHMKEDPGSTPKPAPQASESKKELSFAERMKAMKDGKPPEETPPAAQPTPQPAPAPAASVQQAAPKPAAPVQQAAPKPAADTSISDRVKNLQQATPSQAPKPAAPAPQPARPAHKDEPYKDLPTHIGEVKKLLMLANELKLDVSTSKAVINKAVTAGKNRDLDAAVNLVREGKVGIEKELRTVYSSKIRTMESALALEQKAGKDVSDPMSRLNDARISLESNDFTAASQALKTLEAALMKTSSSTMTAAELDTISCAIQNSDFLKLNIDEARSLYENAKAAASRNDSQTSLQLTKQAMDSLNKILPSYIAGEMRKAKVALREVKLMNVDISAPVHMLKEANDHVSRGDYCSALQHIKTFKEFVQKATQ